MENRPIQKTYRLLFNKNKTDLKMASGLYPLRQSLEKKC